VEFFLDLLIANQQLIVFVIAGTIIDIISLLAIVKQLAMNFTKQQLLQIAVIRIIVVVPQFHLLNHLGSFGLGSDAGCGQPFHYGCDAGLLLRFVK
jgi:hypothetical protein